MFREIRTLSSILFLHHTRTDVDSRKSDCEGIPRALVNGTHRHTLKEVGGFTRFALQQEEEHELEMEWETGLAIETAQQVTEENQEQDLMRKRN